MKLPPIYMWRLRNLCSYQRFAVAFSGDFSHGAQHEQNGSIADKEAHKNGGSQAGPTDQCAEGRAPLVFPQASNPPNRGCGKNDGRRIKT